MTEEDTLAADPFLPWPVAGFADMVPDGMHYARDLADYENPYACGGGRSGWARLSYGDTAVFTFHYWAPGQRRETFPPPLDGLLSYASNAAMEAFSYRVPGRGTTVHGTSELRVLTVDGARLSAARSWVEGSYAWTLRARWRWLLATPRNKRGQVRFGGRAVPDGPYEAMAAKLPDGRVIAVTKPVGGRLPPIASDVCAIRAAAPPGA